MANKMRTNSSLKVKIVSLALFALVAGQLALARPTEFVQQQQQQQQSGDKSPDCDTHATPIIKQLCLYQHMGGVGGAQQPEVERQLIEALTRELLASAESMAAAHESHVRTSRTVSGDQLVNRLLHRPASEGQLEFVDLYDTSGGGPSKSARLHASQTDELGLSSRWQPMRGKRFVYESA